MTGTDSAEWAASGTPTDSQKRPSDEAENNRALARSPLDGWAVATT
jgi:hypothetical protein